MSATLPRIMAMLRHVPRYPRKTDTATLQQRLDSAGYQISQRSIQRDLNELSLILPLVSDSARPQGWSWQAEAEQFHLPFLEPQAALAFHLVERYLQTLLPESTLEYLAPWFRTAANVLETSNTGMTQWPDKVRLLPRGLRLQSPRIAPEVHSALYGALLDERQVMVGYRQRHAAAPKDYLVHPLGIVTRDTVIYLVCTIREFTDVRQLALHRMHSVTVLEEACSRPSGFSLDDYIARGAFGYPESGEMLLLDAVFAARAAAHLAESPLSDDQCITEAGEGLVRVRATVLDTKELRWWLLGFGDQVTVNGPPGLREHIRAHAADMAAGYGLSVSSAA